MPRARARPAAPPPQTAPPPAPPPDSSPVAAVTAATAAGLLLGPETQAVAVPEFGKASAEAVAKAVAALLGAFSVFNARRREQQMALITTTVTRMFPERTPIEVLEIARAELAREREFVRKQRERLDRDLPEAYSLPDVEQRRLRVEAILARERRYEKMREKAMLERATSRAKLMGVEAVSPRGGYWVLGLATKHTPACVALAAAGFWPWSVLHVIHPQLHGGCKCDVISEQEAVARGLMHPDQALMDETDALHRAEAILKLDEAIRAVATDDEIGGYVEAVLIEGRGQQRRYPRGTVRGGEFMPKRGGTAAPVGRKLVHDALRKLIPVAPVSMADRRKDGSGEWRKIAGREVFVPEHRAFEREINGKTYYCLGPETKLLCVDLVWRRLGDLEVGAELVAFEEEAPERRPRRFCRAEVESLGRAVLNSYEVRTSWGTTLASEGHLWLVRLGAREGRKREEGCHVWLRTDDLRAGDEIVALSRPWAVEDSREAGYLAGLYDGEGYVSSDGRMGFGQREGAVMGEVRRLLRDRGYEFSESPVGDRDVLDLRLRGGIGEQLRLLGSLRPVRLLPRSNFLWEGRGMVRGNGRPTRAEVLSVEPVGEREVVTIGTTTRTLIADGLLSHNSPPGSTEVYEKDGFVRNSPEIPRERGQEVSATVEKMRVERRRDAHEMAAAALAGQSEGKPPTEVGAPAKPTHSGMLDAGFRTTRNVVVPGGIQFHYVHHTSGARASVAYVDHQVAHVAWVPGEHPMKAGPVLTRPPKSWEEFAADVFNIAHEIAERNGGKASIARVEYAPEKTDHLGEHTWGDVTRLGRDTRVAIHDLARSRETGRPLTYEQARSVYATYRTAIHEALHAAKPITKRDFHAGSNRAVEEALTEELSAIETADVLRRQGLDDVLRWLKANPNDYKVEGSYSHFRIALTRVFVRAGVPPDKYEDCIRTLKFSFEPGQRMHGMASLVTHGGDHPIHNNFEQELAWVKERFRRSEALDDSQGEIAFAPNLRPDLRDVADTPPLEIDGEKVWPGSYVHVRQPDGVHHYANVQQIRGSAAAPYLDVRYADGSVGRAIPAEAIVGVGIAPIGQQGTVDSVTVGGVTIRPGDVVSYTGYGDGPDPRTMVRVERITRATNPDRARPERGWQIEATTIGDHPVPVLLSGRRARGIRMETPVLREHALTEGKPSAPQKCHYCAEPAVKSLIHAEGFAYVPVCAGHEAKARKDLGAHEVNDEVLIEAYEEGVAATGDTM